MQIGHNVVIGRHCVLVRAGGVSGSTVIGDFAALGGQAGLTGHLTHRRRRADRRRSRRHERRARRASDGAARRPSPLREFFREVAAVKKLAGRAGAREPGGS